MPASPSPSPDSDELSIGSVLDGRYRIDALLGAGGMGRVYRGEHTGIGKRVAIKVLHADLSRNREAAQRFQREAIASGRLDHPNIVGVSDFGIVDDGPCYLVMEVLDGEPLGTRIEREKQIPWREAIEIMRGVLHGLHHAHERGVVHRDIKPDNVFLANKDGEMVVKILDFGIAKLYAGSPDDPASTRAGLTVGTPAYLSPEQAVGGEIKPQSDLYSATILLFEMITGRAPFEDKDPLAMLGAHVSRTPPTIAEAAPELRVPQALEEVIQGGLVKAQNDRIASAQQYLALLDQITAAYPLPAPRQQSTSDAVLALGHAHTQGALTPMPHLATPPLGSIPPNQLIATPPPGSIPPHYTGPHTPYTPTPFAPVSGAAPTLALSTHSVSLGEAPVPRNWTKIGVLVFAGIVALAILFALAGRGGSSPSIKPPSTVKPTVDEEPKTVARPEGKKSDAKPEPKKDPEPENKPENKPEKPDIIADKPDPEPEPTKKPSDAKTQLKAALHDLQSGKTCAERKAAIPKLVALKDKAAIEPLRRARYRGRGGLFGIGEKNANACLRASAESAIKALGGKLR